MVANTTTTPSVSESGQRRSIQTRDRLIEAAIEMFATRGFKASTTREIVRAAGVALASVPYHFKTKEQLWKASVDRIYAGFNERLIERRRMSPGLDPRSQSRNQLREFLLFTVERPEFIRLLLHEGTADTPRLRWFVETHLRPQFEYVEAEIRGAQQSGYGRVGRPDQIFFMIIGSIGLLYAVGPAFEQISNRSATDEELVASHIESVLELFYPSAED